MLARRLDIVARLAVRAVRLWSGYAGDLRPFWDGGDNIGENYNYFPTPIYYDSGGMGNLCRIILTQEGELISIEKTPPASDSSWYYKFCGPHVEIAETLLGLNDNEISYHFEMTRDFSELISDYLTFYFS